MSTVIEKKRHKIIWNIKPQGANDGLVERVSHSFGISAECAALVCQRADNDADAVSAFLSKNRSLWRDPFILADMRPAVDRITRGIDDGEIIAVYGDYDADGVTSTSLLYLYLASRGAHVGYYIPKRSDEGYGMSREGVDKLAAKGVTLIITVDTGVTAVSEVEYCRELGIDVVVTDHHECLAELPSAVAVVDPHRPDCPYPFKEMAGVGVALKLVCALESERAKNAGEDASSAISNIIHTYADLAAIGTVADVMPLVDENRLIVSAGIELIEGRSRLGVSALVDAASGAREGKEPRSIDATFIGFGIAPRINAAGRMENASVAVELLLADTPQTAQALAEYLCEINRTRQSVENSILDEALDRIYDEHDLRRDKVIVLADDGWNHGVIGIVASRIVEKFSMPAILVTFDSADPVADSSPHDIGRGSGRSIKGMNLVEALTACSDCLVKYGGHELAAGLSIERHALPEFRRKINEYAAGIFADGESETVIEADGVLSAEGITMKLAEEIGSFVEPCGAGNPSPLFVLEGANVTAVRGVGAGKHCRLTVEACGRHFSAMYFNITPSELACEKGDSVDLLFGLGVNRYMGKKELQLTVEDVRPSAFALACRRAERARFEDIMSGGSFSADEGFMPSRRDLVNLYSIICALAECGRVSVSDKYALYLLRTKLPERESVGYVKYKLMVEIFAATGIFKIRKTECEDEVTSFETLEHKTKIDIEKSELFVRLKAQCFDAR